MTVSATPPPLQPQQQPPSSSDGPRQHDHPVLRHPRADDDDFAAWRARLSARLAALPPEQAPIVLVACGSFNPPTRAHLRMFAAGAAAVDGASAGSSAGDGADAQTQTLSVVGGLLSPVGDGYGKAGLAPAAHRLAMCALAAEAGPKQVGAEAEAITTISSSGPLLPVPPQQRPPPRQVDVCVHGWEAARGGGRRVHTRTLDVLRHIERALNSAADGGGREGEAAATAAAAAAAATPSARPLPSRSPPPPPPFVRVMLLGGADLVESMRRPGVWSEPDALLREHGVVCVDRPGHTAGPSTSSSAAAVATTAAATEAAAPAVDHALLESRVLRAECDEEVMSGVSSSRAREALRAALAEAEAGGTAAATTVTRDRAAAAVAVAHDPRVAKLLEPRVAEYALLNGLYCCGE